MKEVTDENDIIIRIADRLRARTQANGTCTIEYDDEDLLMIPKGSIEKHLEAAAKDAGLEVARKGATQASLRKSSDFFIA